MTVPSETAIEVGPRIETTLEVVTVFTGNRFPLVAVTVFNAKKFLWFMP